MTERKRWETALRCLEVALHPRTNDKEVIAGVNGFRRTAGDVSLQEICVEIAGNSESRRAAPAVEWQAIDRLNRANQRLRGEFEALAERHAAAEQRLREAERRIAELSVDWSAAHKRAHAAERRLAELQLALDGVSQENRNLRSAVDLAMRQVSEMQAKRTVAPFRAVLAEACSRASMPEPRAMRTSASRVRHQNEGAAGNFRSNFQLNTTPWTA